MKFRFYIFILFLLLGFINKSYAELRIHTRYEITIDVPNTIDIQNCLKWHVDFSRIKTTVYYQNCFISVGKHGGFICIDAKNFVINQIMTDKLNSDLFTNAIVRNDTLIAESYLGLYYLNQDTNWISYDLKEPILLFKIALEDSENIFYNDDCGEYGGALYIYNKKTKETKIIVSILSPTVNSVVKTNCGYVNSPSLKPGWAFSPMFKILVDSLESQNIQDVIIDYESTGRQWYLGPDILIIPKKNKLSLIKFPEKCQSIKESVFITSKYSNSVGVYDDNGFLNNWLENNDRVSKFKSTKENGFTIVKGDTIIKVSYNFRPSYDKSFRINGKPVKYRFVLFDNDTAPVIINKITTYSYNNNWKDTYVITRELIYDINSEYGVEWIKTDSTTSFLVQYNNSKFKIPIDSKNTVLQYCFLHKNLFLYFETLGNRNHKYGLIEITNMEEFLRIYGN